MIYLMKGGEIRLIDEDGTLSQLSYDLDYYLENKDAYCIIEDDYTVKDLFLMIEKNSDCFTSRFSNLILNYIIEIKSTEETECPVECLYFSWVCIEKDGYLKDNILRYPIFNQEYIDMVEEVRSDEDEGEDEVDGELENDPFSIDEFALSEIKNAKIILNETFDIYKYEDNVDGDMMKIGPEPVSIFSSKRRFSFFDIIYETIFTLCPDLEFEIEDIDDDISYLNEEAQTHDTTIVVKDEKAGIKNLYKQLNDLEGLL